MSLESSFWGWLRQCWKDAGFTPTQLHYTRVENSASNGMPDLEGCYHGKQFWAELKVSKRPASADSPVNVDHFRAKQVEWLFNRWLANGRAWLLLRVEGRRGPAKTYLIPGKHGRLVLAGVTEAQLEELSVCHPLTSGEGLLHLMTA